MRKLVCIFILSLCFTTNVFAASFDCKKARTDVEKTICADKKLSELDEKLDKMYKQAMSLTTQNKEQKELKKDQLAWLKKRNAPDSKKMLDLIYDSRIEELFSIIAPLEVERLYKQALSIVPYKKELQKQQLAWQKKLDATKSWGLAEVRYFDRIAELSSTISAFELAQKAKEQQKKTSETDRRLELIQKRFLPPAEEKELLITVAKNSKVDDWKPKPTKEEKQELKLCTVMLEDLKAGKNFEVVEPIVRTDDYNEPKLQQYLGKCRKLHPNKIIMPRGTDWSNLRMTDDEVEEFGESYFSHLDYRLYHVDFDNNPRNGKEYLFYHGGNTDKDGVSSVGDLTEYIILNLKNCQEADRQQLTDTINFNTNKVTAYNGIIKHASKYMIYDISYSSSENIYSLTIYSYNKRIKRTTTMCFTK